MPAPTILSTLTHYLTMPTKPDEKRVLNLEEKRPLEKLLLSDITAATTNYNAARQAERRKLKESLITNAPKEIRALSEERAKAEKEMERAVAQLGERGYCFGGYPKNLLINDYGKQPPELTTFDAETKRIDKRMTELKREYTLRLFAGGEEAKALFSTLESAIADILRS